MAAEWLNAALIGYYPTGPSEVALRGKNIPLRNEWMGILDFIDVEQQCKIGPEATHLACF
jgi:hypothetical protein